MSTQVLFGGYSPERSLAFNDVWLLRVTRGGDGSVDGSVDGSFDFDESLGLLFDTGGDEIIYIHNIHNST